MPKTNKKQNKNKKQIMQQKNQNVTKVYRGDRSDKKDKKKPKEPNNEVITYLPTRHANASSTRNNIMVKAICATLAAETACLSLITRACVFNANDTTSNPGPVYWAYEAFMKDLLSVMAGDVPSSMVRLTYVSEILSSINPKTIPFKQGSKLAYSWSNTDNIHINPAVTIRGYTYYMYQKTGGTSGPWSLQGPPGTASALEYSQKLSQIYTLLSGNKDCLRVTKNVDLGQIYANDVSSFAAGSPYYGGGSSSIANAPSFSVESEVPFKSQILAGYATYDKTRVARRFHLSAGDPCAAYGLPFIENFAMKHFNSVYPVQYKFIDIDEFVVAIQSYYIGLVQQYAETVARGVVSNDAVAYALTPLSYSAEAFRIFWRQIILSMFSESQGAAQFLTYSEDNNGFEPLRVGTNCYPPNTITARLPSIMIENIRMLQPRIAEVKTSYYNAKNVLIYVPVLGVYKNRSQIAYNITGNFYKRLEDGTLSAYSNTVCEATDNNAPNVIDGRDGSNQVCDLNTGELQNFITDWNERIISLQSAASHSGFLGGSSPGSLLTTTRYLYHKSIDYSMSDYPVYKKSQLDKTFLVRRPKEIQRTTSREKNRVEVEEYYVPPNFSLYTQFTQSYSSLFDFTEELKVITRYFVLPSMYLDDDGSPPTQRQARVQYAEGRVWDWADQGPRSPITQLDALRVYGTLCASGIANNNNDELVAAVSAYNTQCKGGFIGDVLGIAGDIANSLGV